VVRGALARAHQRQEGGRRGGVLDHALPALAESEHLPPPVERDFLELGERGAGLPVEPELSEPGADQVAEHRGRQAVRRKIAVEAGILPMGACRQDQRVEVAPDGREILWLLRRPGGQRPAQRARCIARHHGEFAGRDPRAVVGDPVDEFVAGLAEFLGRHGVSPISWQKVSDLEC
jgi:hypothetical protein